MSQHLRHDTAMAAARAILDMVSPCLTTESERTEAFGMFYEAMIAALTKYDELLARELKRLCRPSPN